MTELPTSIITSEDAEVSSGALLGSGGGPTDIYDTTIGTLAARPLVPATDRSRYFATDTAQEFLAVAGAWVLLDHSGSAPGTIVGTLAARPASPTGEGERYWTSDTDQEFIGVGTPPAWVEIVRSSGGGIAELRLSRIFMTNYLIEFDAAGDAIDILYWPGIAETTPLASGDIVTNKIIMGNYVIEYNIPENTLDIRYAN